jgi:diguanylate cyclase (GGDEF)-like protein
MSTLAEAIESVWNAARADDLTSLMNALALKEQIEVVLSDVERQWLVVFGDINRFKTFNDQHSHAVGDAAIAVVGGILKQIMDACQGFGFRKSGDEFVALLPARMLDTFRSLVRERFAAAVVKHQGKHLPITISFGYVVPGNEDSRTLQGRAEAACRLAKLKGPGEVVEWTVEIVDMLPLNRRVHCDVCRTQFDCSIPRESKRPELRCPNCGAVIAAPEGATT